VRLIGFISVAAMVAAAQTASAQSAQKEPAVHELIASPSTVHRDYFDASFKPVLTIDSGDIVRLKTASGNPRYFESLGVPRAEIPGELFGIFYGVDNDEPGDHTLNGPIMVRGAEPGDTIEIRIRSVDVWLPLAHQAFLPNMGLLPDEFPYQKDRALRVDLKA
jgi:acetamidase/formamidase